MTTRGFCAGSFVFRPEENVWWLFPVKLLWQERSCLTAVYNKEGSKSTILTNNNSLLIDGELTQKDPLTWYKVHRGSQENRRYITTLIPSNPKITNVLEVNIGVDKNCENKRADEDFCNGPLVSGKKYRWVSQPGILYFVFAGYRNTETDLNLQYPWYTQKRSRPRISKSDRLSHNFGKLYIDLVRSSKHLC